MDPLTQNPQQAQASEPMTPAAAPMQQAPSMPSMPKSMGAKKHSFGPLIGAVIIIAILIAGALYFWSPLLMPDSEQSTALYNPSTSVASDTQVSAAAAAIDQLQSGIDQDMNSLQQSIK